MQGVCGVVHSGVRGVTPMGLVARPDPNEALRATRYSRPCGRGAIGWCIWANEKPSGQGGGGRFVLVLAGIGLVAQG